MKTIERTDGAGAMNEPIEVTDQVADALVRRGVARIVQEVTPEGASERFQKGVVTSEADLTPEPKAKSKAKSEPQDDMPENKGIEPVFTVTSKG